MSRYNVGRLTPRARAAADVFGAVRKASRTVRSGIGSLAMCTTVTHGGHLSIGTFDGRQETAPTVAGAVRVGRIYEMAISANV